MSDIVERLLRWGYSADPSTANDLMGEAVDEIDRLRGDAEVARLRLEAAHAESERLRLTDAEREAVEWVIGQRRERESRVHAALRGLLDRLGGGE